MKTIITKSEKETMELGRKMAKKFKGGEVIGLKGELGSGKTVLVKGMAQGLGIKKNITSPTFILMKVYPVKKHKTIKNFCHIDAYRIEGAEQLKSLDVFDYLGREDTVCVVEWINKVPALKEYGDFVKVKIDLGRNNKLRFIKYGRASKRNSKT